ncbi:MAG TPA: high-potential iron-sulfur protein [Burkholderiaceae bacterium]|nr:high-potential iron-sulfur protein [Burkholderiaceae bacterium]
MQDKIQPARRTLLKIGGALAAIPVVAVTGNAFAAQNAALRSALKYQDQPKGEQRCSTCMHFVPGKTPTERGGCKIIPGDTEISPNGWCVSWVAAPKK